MQMEQKTNYEAPLLSVETASAECGFAQSGGTSSRYNSDGLQDFSGDSVTDQSSSWGF